MTNKDWKNIEAKIKWLLDDSDDNTGDDRDVVAREVWASLDGGHKDVLAQLLFQGPVWDGNIVSKASRDDLIDLGLAVRCCFMGDYGHTAASYLACTVFRAGGATPMATRAGSPG